MNLYYIAIILYNCNIIKYNNFDINEFYIYKKQCKYFTL